MSSRARGCPSQAVSRGTVADPCGAGDRRALGYFFRHLDTVWPVGTLSASRSRWTEIE